MPACYRYGFSRLREHLLNAARPFPFTASQVVEWKSSSRPKGGTDLQLQIRSSAQFRRFLAVRSVIEGREVFLGLPNDVALARIRPHATGEVCE
jgi:hypothetical protein